jgi:hypothetical protein
LDTLLKFLYLVLILVPQELKKGETRGKKGITSIFEWKAHIWVKHKRSVNMWESGWGIYISCQLTNFHIQIFQRQATTWHHWEEIMKL